MKRKRVSVTLFVTFLFLPVSAIFIHSSGHIGFIAKRIHGLCGLIFTVMGIYHIIYNWKTLKLYFKKK
jgi:hypothetical protein